MKTLPHIYLWFLFSLLLQQKYVQYIAKHGKMSNTHKKVNNNQTDIWEYFNGLSDKCGYSPLILYQNSIG